MLLRSSGGRVRGPRAEDRRGLLLYGEENQGLKLRTTSKTEATEILLGLVNYFKDHVQGLSHKVKPLNEIMIPYKKGMSIDWTPRLEQCCWDVQESVGNCPKLFYVDLGLPIRVRTDASDYGIGGYIFQLDQQRELPIRFISKALHRAQLNWSTFEKEAYAIVYTITKFDFLLRDVKFVVETDSKNLTFFKTAKSAKMRRWQLALQEFDFEYIHIKGEDNVVADAFSRLCDHHPIDGEANTETLTAFLMASDSIGSSAPTYEPRSNSNSKKPVTTEPSIDPILRTKIEAVHSLVSGHSGVECTCKVLLGKGVDDDGLRRAVTKFVRDCPVCQLRSVLNRQIKTHRFTTASYTPMEVLNIDTIGPVSKDSADNCYILVIIDCFTRFVELYPVSDTSALPCARTLLSHVCRYGTPMTIRSDHHFR